MAMIRGPMLQGRFLPEEEYIKEVTQLIRLERDKIINYLLEIHKSILTSPQAAYLAWERFSTEIFGNPKTQLLSIINFTGRAQKQSWVIADEKYAIQPDGLINVEKLGKTIRHEYYSDILTKHLSNMFKTVTKKKISKTALSYLSSKYGFYVQNPSVSNSLPFYKDVFWSYGEQGWKMRGQIAEAFLTHLSKMHLSQMQGDKLSIDFSNQSILQAEGPTGFVDLLYASKNRDVWYSGGDLIVTNNKGEVIANIQLKTSFGTGSAIGRIKTSQLSNDITLLLRKINSPEEMARSFFETLKTSAIETQLDYSIEKEGMSIVENMLKSVDIPINL